MNDTDPEQGLAHRRENMDFTQKLKKKNDVGHESKRILKKTNELNLINKKCYTE